jgi:hypothetical protein
MATTVKKAKKMRGKHSASGTSLKTCDPKKGRSRLAVGTLDKGKRTIQSTWEPSEGETSLSVALEREGTSCGPGEGRTRLPVGMEREGRDFLSAGRGRNKPTCLGGTCLPVRERNEPLSVSLDGYEHAYLKAWEGRTCLAESLGREEPTCKPGKGGRAYL